LALIWGSSFLLIKIGVAELNAFTLVSGRLGSAAVAFIITLAALRKHLPRDTKTVLILILVGIMNTAVPFVLITWGEQRIDSGLAGVLDGTVPLFSFVIAHFALHDDKLSLGKIFGLIAGFAGVVLLALRSADPTHPNPIEGQIAVLVASIAYAFSAVLIRRNLQHVDPIVTAGSTLCVGAITVIVVTLITGQTLPVLSELQPKTILAVLTLGLVNTFIAYILFFTLIKDWGASRTTMVAYVLPIVALILGVIFNNERPDVSVIFGALLIIGGVVFASLRQNAPTVAIEQPQAAR
jgi:drug/metabolite transporter (DMT)-like permease